MQPFTVLRGPAVPMWIDNIDTDAITPSAAGKSTSVDLGAMLFNNARYHLDGSENKEFILNQEKFRHSKILVAGKNFGSGSSRERAVWALMKFGIRCVIAPSFADIFYDNSFQNGLLPLILPAAECELLAKSLLEVAEPLVSVDLIKGEVILPGPKTLTFSIPHERREALLKGLDEISIILGYDSKIRSFELQDFDRRPWVDPEGLPNDD
jgi:3-isopropylmalate/(R)-2-methylmalate dehydratase small subunit